MLNQGYSRRLSVARLALSDFRNFKNAVIDLTPHCVVITGANGSGKTNCLEAVSLLAPGRGLRGAASQDMERLGGAGGWSIAAKVLSGGEEIAIGTGRLAAGDPAMKRGAGRIVKIDGQIVPSPTRLAEAFAVVWLTPAMDGLFTGPASDRRKFLDRLTVACHPAHSAMLARFDLAMRQRNRLLESASANARLFEGYERQMAETGVAIAAARVETVDRLRALIEARLAAGASAFPWADVAVEGDLERELRERPAVDVEDAFTERLAASRDRDRQAGRTRAGPHASDFIVGFGPKQMPARLSSTGEQKSLLVGLVLAQADLIRESRGGQAPVILLDEIAAHLDSRRREALFEEIIRLDSQAWMTGTDEDAFAPLGGHAQYLKASPGAIDPGVKTNAAEAAEIPPAPYSRRANQRMRV